MEHFHNFSLCHEALRLNMTMELEILNCFWNTSLPHVDFVPADLLHHKEWRIFLITLYIIVIVFGFLENLLVFLVIVSNKQLHTVTNIFISTLALSDIVMCVFSLPFQLHYGITRHWAFGSVLCHIINPLFAIPVFVSTLTILMIAVERFVLIVFPFRQKMSTCTTKIVVVLIVITSICLSSPVIIFTELHEVTLIVPDMNVNIHQTFCTESWQSDLASRSYTLFVFIVQFFIPDIVIWTIVRNLGPAFHFTDLLLKIVAMSSACINPFFYGWLNDNFRKEFGSMVGRRMKRLQMRNSGLTTSCNDENETPFVVRSDRQDRRTTTL
ncbi:hypothetical protein FSP39_015031 [Pinctada imbricata]|uniref:G-protein coupled receptors family 1 profile domain-containing protein n=1 Tax=Pinctada imbricata TaxID=66713 RepID=A0AA88Y3L1_PINIB|nr:hypothetical protein FSP39_015031 [Pinctada imbricata]